jgi:hypothetical protein
MASAFDALLDPTGDAADTPEKAAALAAALKRQNRYGAIGQLMGVQPTQQVGAGLQEQSQGSLKMALAQRQAAKEAAARANERQQAQANWQAEMERNNARDAEQRRQFAQQEQRLRNPPRDPSERLGQLIETENGYVRVTPDNKVIPVNDAEGQPIRKPPALPKEPTESQRTLATYGTRLEQNLPTIEKLLDGGYRPSPKDYSLGTADINNPTAKLLSRSAMSKDARIYYGAASQIVNAIMRRESGAAISAGEWATANDRWFPTPGDPPELIASKRENLARELEQLKMQSGGAWPKQQQGEQQGEQQGVGERVNAPAQQGARPGDKYLEGG